MGSGPPPTSPENRSASKNLALVQILEEMRALHKKLRKLDREAKKLING
jgi:hypothetical protein